MEANACQFWGLFGPNNPIELPPRAYHCTAIIDDDRLMVAGGNTDEGIVSSAYMYSKSADAWTQLPDMETDRGLVSCRAIAKEETGETEVIVPGGYSSLGYYLSDVEIYNVQSGLWRTSGKGDASTLLNHK